MGLAPFSAGDGDDAPLALGRSAVEMEMKPPNEEGDEEDIAPRLKHRALTTGRYKSLKLNQGYKVKCFMKK